MHWAIRISALFIFAINLISVSHCNAQEDRKQGELSPRIGKRFAHPDAGKIVSSLSVSPDGSKIIGSNYPQNNIQVWDVESGDARLFIDSPDEGKGSLDFWRPNGDYSKLYLWIESPGLFRRIERGGREGSVRAYPNSEIQVWDLATKTKTSLKKPANQVRYLTMCPDHRYLLSQEEMAGTFFGDQTRTTRLLDIESGEWKDLGSDISFMTTFDHAGGRIAAFDLDESKRYVTGISVKEFPSLEESTNIKLPDGIHGNGAIRFCENEKYLVAEYRTYEAKNTWNVWRTTIVCFDLETGDQVGKYAFPYNNDSPLFLDQDLRDNTLVFNTWRQTPKMSFGLEIPTLKEKWEFELGDYRMARDTVIHQSKNWFAILCVSDSEYFAGGGKIDWEQVPLNDLKVIDAEGNLLETISLPAGTQTITMGQDGTAAFGTVGSVYLLNLDPPFQHDEAK